MIRLNLQEKQVQSAMKEDQDDHTRSTRKPVPAFDTNPFEKQTSGPARQDDDRHYFSNLDEELDPTYEETDRDTDFAPALREDAREEYIGDDAFEELLPEDLESDDESLFAEQEAFLQAEAGNLLMETQSDESGFWSTVDDLDKPWPDDAEREETREQNTAGLDDEDDWEQNQEASTSEALWLGAAAGNEPSQSTDDDQWYDEDEFSDDEFESERWPISLIVIGTLALLLVIAGVYGIVQDRLATQDQIRQLQASLATAVSPDEVDASRTALQDANERSRALSTQVSQLRSENQRLTDTVAGLEAQVAAMETAPAPTAAPIAPKPATAPKPKAPAAKPAETTTAAVVAGTGWFVNFGSYGEEAIAKDWADKLTKDFGNVIVASSSKDGRTYYRVRVVGLGSRDAAENTARKLESAYGLPKLWVGRQ